MVLTFLSLTDKCCVSSKSASHCSIRAMLVMFSCCKTEEKGALVLGSHGVSDFCRVDKDYIVVLRLLACVLEIGRTLLVRMDF